MFFTAIITLLVGYVLLILIVYVRQGSMVYFPEKEVSYTPADIGLSFQEITISTKDEISLSAWFVPSENERAVLLFCHGNAGNISLFGRSLGSAVAVETALKKDAGALIVESGFTSLPDLGSTIYRFLPVRLLSRFQYASIDKINRIAIPKLIIHSPDDDIISFEHGEKLFRKAKEPKTFLEIAGGHNEGFMLSGEIYKRGLNTFLEKNFPKN
jgi:fermentation-respiration switch protein FrsA (DUF1100 family)